MAKVLFTIFFSTFFVCSSQIIKPTSVVSQHDPNNTLVENSGEVAQDSLIFKAVFDNEHAAALDQKWLEDLYSNTLFDSVYQSVTDMSFENVEYPELPTDTLKARLK